MSFGKNTERDGARRPDENDLAVNTPGSAESHPTDISWKNRYRNGVLLLCISITYLAYCTTTMG